MSVWGRMGQLAGARREADDTVGCKINSKTKMLRKATAARTGKPDFPKDALAAVARRLGANWAEHPSASSIPFASSSAYPTPASFPLCSGAVPSQLLVLLSLLFLLLPQAFCILHNSVKTLVIKISKKTELLLVFYNDDYRKSSANSVERNINTLSKGYNFTWNAKFYNWYSLVLLKS